MCFNDSFIHLNIKTICNSHKNLLLLITKSTFATQSSRISRPTIKWHFFNVRNCGFDQFGTETIIILNNSINCVLIIFLSLPRTKQTKITKPLADYNILDALYIYLLRSIRKILPKTRLYCLFLVYVSFEEEKKRRKYS